MVRQWIKSKEKLSADKLAALSPRLKYFAKSIDQYLIVMKDKLVRGSVIESTSNQNSAVEPRGTSNLVL